MFFLLLYTNDHKGHNLTQLLLHHEALSGSCSHSLRRCPCPLKYVFSNTIGLNSSTDHRGIFIKKHGNLIG